MADRLEALCVLLSGLSPPACERIPNPISPFSIVSGEQKDMRAEQYVSPRRVGPVAVLTRETWRSQRLASGALAPLGTRTATNHPGPNQSGVSEGDNNSAGGAHRFRAQPRGRQEWCSPCTIIILHTSPHAVNIRTLGHLAGVESQEI